MNTECSLSASILNPQSSMVSFRNLCRICDYFIISAQQRKEIISVENILQLQQSIQVLPYFLDLKTSEGIKILIR